MTCSRSTFLAACLVAIAACDPGSKSVTATVGLDDSGSSTGSDSSSDSGKDTGDTETGDYGGNCEETITVLAGVDAVGPTGISPGPVLAEAEGTYTGALRWIAFDGPVVWQGPGDPTPLEVEVAYAGGEIRDVDAELVSPCLHDGPCPCSDRLEIDVRFRIVSDDGALDETWTVALKHQPENDYFSPVGTSMYHRFDPDATTGTLSRGSFAIDPDTVLDEMVMTGQFRGGALEGAFNVQVSQGGPDGWVGFGPVSNFGTVTSLEACPGISGNNCDAAGCTAVPGIPVWGQDDSCNCGDPEDFCFAGPLVGEEVPTMYTRPDAYEEGLDLVYVFDTAIADPPAPWRLCADAPGVPSCSCFDGMGTCP